MARRDEREYREYLSELQRSQPGCPARELCHELRGRDTSGTDSRPGPQARRSRTLNGIQLLALARRDEIHVERLTHVIKKRSRRLFGIEHEVPEWQPRRRVLVNGFLCARQPQQIPDDGHRLIRLSDTRRHPTDVAADDGMAVNRGVVQKAALLISPASRKTVTNTKRNLDDRTAILNACQLLVNGRPIESGQRNGCVEIVEGEKHNERPDVARAKALGHRCGRAEALRYRCVGRAQALRYRGLKGYRRKGYRRMAHRCLGRGRGCQPVIGGTGL